MVDPHPEPDDEPRLADDPRLTTAGLLFEATAGLQALLAPQLAEHDLSPSELEVLLRLERSPRSQLRMSDLARQADLSASGLTRLADRLERRGLLERRACPVDRRGLEASLTAEGRARLRAVLPGHLARLDQGLTGLLAPRQREALEDTLRTIRAQVRPGAEVGAHEAEAPAGP